MQSILSKLNADQSPFSRETKIMLVVLLATQT